MARCGEEGAGPGRRNEGMCGEWADANAGEAHAKSSGEACDEASAGVERRQGADEQGVAGGACEFSPTFPSFQRANGEKPEVDLSTSEVVGGRQRKAEAEEEASEASESAEGAGDADTSTTTTRDKAHSLPEVRTGLRRKRVDTVVRHVVAGAFSC